MEAHPQRLYISRGTKAQRQTEPRPTAAGASAPETVVEQCVNLLRDRFDATVESRSIRDEEVYFPLPKELRQVAASQG